MYNPGTERHEEHAKVYVECDLVEHGIARAYELAYESAQNIEKAMGIY
jgi:hypothetical protein